MGRLCLKMGPGQERRVQPTFYLSLNGTEREVNQQRTSCPVQNMGHWSHGGFLASASHVLRYGFRTTSGRTGGVRDEACTKLPNAAQDNMNEYILKRMSTSKRGSIEA